MKRWPPPCSCGLKMSHAHDPNDEGSVVFIDFPELTDEECELLYEAELRRKRNTQPN